MLLVSIKRLSSSGMFVRSPIVPNCVQRVWVVKIRKEYQVIYT